MKKSQAKKKKKRWVKFRHKAYTFIASRIIGPFIKRKCRVKIDKFDKKDKRQFLILYNHQTAYDQFFVGLSFNRTIYYVASEDLFSNGFLSKVIKHVVAPVPIKKQTTDMRAVMDCTKIAKEGGTIAIAPEGNRTYSGKTEYFKQSIVKFARLTKLPLVMFKIQGGYGVQPRWSDKIRKGKMQAGVSRIIDYDDYKNMSDEELYNIIKKELYVNEGQNTGEYNSPRRAEYLERAMYVCRKCGFSTFESHGNNIKCLKCGEIITYGADKKLKSNYKGFPFEYVNGWYEYQNNYVINSDIKEYIKKPLYIEKANVLEVIVYKKKKVLAKQVEIKLYANKIRLIKNDKCSKNLQTCIDFDNVSTLSVLGRNKLNVYFNDKLYQIKSDKRFNALKYVNIYHKYLNEKVGNNGKFLGL